MDFSEIPERLRYNPRAEKALTKQNVHRGQAKMFAALLDFMQLTQESCKHMPVVYIGAGPGTNISAVAQLYPDTCFLLYDKVPFDRSLDRLSNVKIIRKYVDDHEARFLKARYGVGKTRVFSDIRSLDVGEKKRKGDIAGHLSLVEKDMAIQRSFTDILKPCAAMFKFRLPWTKGKTEWYAGDIRLQAYARPFSTETRLFVPDVSKTREYDHKEYEEKLFFFNSRMRPEADKKIMDAIIAGSPDPSKARRLAKNSFPMPGSTT